LRNESAYLLGRRRTLIVLSGLLLGMLLAALNQTIVTTALPRIVGDLGGFEAASRSSRFVGAAMFGTIMFIPLFVQGVLSDSAASSGAVLTPLMLALIGTSVAAGQLVSRTGRYRGVLLSAPLVLLGGFLLLTQLDADSTSADVTLDMVVIGLGLGLGMQTYVLVVQNAAPPRMMGVVTAATQFSRSVGGTIGVTAMGALLTARLGSGAVISTSTRRARRRATPSRPRCTGSSWRACR
jgi:MFS family permease